MAKNPPGEAAPRQSLPPFSRATSQALADRLRALESSGEIRRNGYVDVCKAAGVTFDSRRAPKGYVERLSNWINHTPENWDLLGEENEDNEGTERTERTEGNYARLAAYLINKYSFFEPYIHLPIMTLLRAPVYHAIASLLNCQNRDFIINSMQGRYKTYRASTRKAGYGFIGLMEIKYDRKAGAITIRDRYKKSEEEIWDNTGTMFPLSDKEFIILIANAEYSTVKVLYINERGTPKRTVNYFYGWMAESDQNKYFSMPLYAERLGENEPEDLDYDRIEQNPKKFPPRIVEYLGRKLSTDTPYGKFVHTPI